MKFLKINISSKKHPNTYTIIDKMDKEKIEPFKWCCSSKGYAVRTGKNKESLSVHRVVMNAKPGQIIDHINGNPLDNRKSNLRFVSSQQNSFNTKKSITNSSGFKGVSWHKNHKLWQACVYFGNTSKFLGNYLTKEEAALAYNLYVKETRGEYANLNIVPNENDIIESVKQNMLTLGKGQKGIPKKFKNKIRKSKVK